MSGNCPNAVERGASRIANPAYYTYTPRPSEKSLVKMPWPGRRKMDQCGLIGVLLWCGVVESPCIIQFYSGEDKRGHKSQIQQSSKARPLLIINS